MAKGLHSRLIDTNDNNRPNSLATGFASIALAAGWVRDIEEMKLIASLPIYDSINPFGQLQFGNYTPKSEPIVVANWPEAN